MIDLNATPSKKSNIRRVAVLGAGTMGAQIAALVAAKGIQCDLLDMSAAMVEDAKQRLLNMRPKVVVDPTTLERIRAGSFDEDLQRLADADWVVEAIVERAGPKLALWSRVADFARSDAILSTNTSGIPIAQIARALPAEMRGRFLGTHFFNPPRYLHLLELIPTSETDYSAISTIRQFGEDVLCKDVVLARDVPGFITNRIGCYYFLAVMRAADELCLTPDEADAVSGPLMGRSNSATYRTIDLVGVDILLDICDNTRAAIASQDEKQAYTAPQYLRDMRENGWLGNKSGKGFYKRERQDGQSRILALNTSTMQYQDRTDRMRESLSNIRAIEDTGERLRALVAADSTAAEFAWRSLSSLLAYSAAMLGEVADDIASIDRAMCRGFNWELGPFETWDALGVEKTVERMKRDGIAVPKWVAAIAREGGNFYRQIDGESDQATAEGKYAKFQDSRA
ncbi:MAG: 3-hydroxyacyl-CoA dehydrogenase family protein [Chloroflexi bacterium]|nr:3-hydroxyacyl-CoA dehydrogenase family protein [Chloroflexota bacterium]